MECESLPRPVFFEDQVLSAEDLQALEDHERAAMARRSLLLGWGIVRGMKAAIHDIPERLKIKRGFALSPLGREICLIRDLILDLRDVLAGAITDPCDPKKWREIGAGQRKEMLYLAIRYAECLMTCVASTSEQGGTRPTRIGESFEIGFLADVPFGEDDGWVILAKVMFADRGRILEIDNGMRRKICWCEDVPE
jgi:hypothetical protein